MIKREELQLVYDWVFETAQRIAYDGDQVLPVVATCRFINGKLRAVKLIAVKDMNTVEHKNKLAALIKELILRPQIDVVCFVTEAWYVGGTLPENTTQEERDAVAEALGGVPPSEHPQRKECVMFSFYTKVYDCFAMCPIERPSGMLIRSELDFSLGNTTGRFMRERVE